MIIRLTVPEIPVSPNGPGGLFRIHWGQRKRMFEAWAWHVSVALNRLGNGPRLPEALKRRRKVFIYQVRTRRLDRDNLWASVKPICDALKKNKLIFDDSEKWIELEVTQSTGKPNKTEITITDL